MSSKDEKSKIPVFAFIRKNVNNEFQVKNKIEYQLEKGVKFKYNNELAQEKKNSTSK